MDLLCAHHIVEAIRMNAGCIYHIFRLQNALAGCQLKALVCLYDILNLCVEFELHAVHGRIFRQGDGQAKRTYDAARGGIERAHHIVRYVGLHLLYFLFCQFLSVTPVKIRIQQLILIKEMNAGFFHMFLLMTIQLAVALLNVISAITFLNNVQCFFNRNWIYNFLINPFLTIWNHPQMNILLVFHNRSSYL